MRRRRWSSFAGDCPAGRPCRSCWRACWHLVTAPILGIAPTDLRPIDHVGRIRAPLLMLIGARDTYTTVAETTAMFARAPQPKSLWIVDGAGHVDLQAHAPEGYRARVLDFLSRHLRRPG
jgi:uncharacterized protein